MKKKIKNQKSKKNENPLLTVFPVWRKMHRSLLTSRDLDSYVSDYRHTEQCERVLMDRERQLDSKSVMLVAKYPSCPVVSK